VGRVLLYMYVNYIMYKMYIIVCTCHYDKDLLTYFLSYLLTYLH